MRKRAKIIRTRYPKRRPRLDRQTLRFADR